MKRTVVTLAILLLCGCHSDQAKVEGFCELETIKFSAQHFDNYAERLQTLKEVQMMHACMQSYGYRSRFDKLCPVDEKGIDILVTEYGNATNPYCYEPEGWGARQSSHFEGWVKSWT